MNEVERSAAFQEKRRENHASNIYTPNVFTSYRTVVPSPRSDWFNQLCTRLDELTSLPVGWDGYLGQPVSFQSANFVANMLERLYQDNVPAPSLVPGSDGSVQVEWHRNSYDVELDVLGVQQVIATRVHCGTGEEETIDIQSDFSDIVDWIRELSDDSLKIS